MSINLGKEIHNIVKSKGLKAKSVAKAVNVSESSLYKIYKRKSIDIDKLIKFSQYLNTNLFVHYLAQEPLKNMFQKESQNLTEEINKLKIVLEQKEKRIIELEAINNSQQKVITLLENTQAKSTHKELPVKRRK